MSSSNEKIARQVGHALADDLTAEEKSEMWNAIEYSRHSSVPPQQRPTARRRYVFRYTGLSGAIIAGVAAMWLFTARVLTRPGLDAGMPQIDESRTTSAVNAFPMNSFVVTHLNIIYIAVSIFLLVLSVWGGICLLVPEQKLSGWLMKIWKVVPGRRLFDSIHGLRRWMASGVFIAIVLLSGLELVDQWQGGPLGREYATAGGIEGVTLAAGQSQWLEAPILNRTGLPIHILSITAVSTPSGLPIETGVIRQADISTQKLAITSPKELEQRFIHGTVTMPDEAHNVHQQYFIPIVVVKGTKPGDFYKINGYTLAYRWGPIFYRVKINYLITVAVKIS